METIDELESDKTTSIGNRSTVYLGRTEGLFRLESDNTTSRGNGCTMYMGTTKGLL